MRTRGGRLARGVCITAFFALVFAGLFSPALVSGRLLAEDDALLQSLPAFQSPPTLWTSYLFSGFPVMGDPQTMAWYPPRLFFSQFPGSWNALVLSAFVLAGCFAYGYLGALTGSRWAALAGGTVYSMSGFFLSHLSHPNMIHSAAWTPLLLWSLERLRNRISPGWIAMSAVATGCCALAGHPQVFVYTLGLGISYLLFFAWRAPSGTWRFAGAGTVGLGMGTALAAILLLPMVELAGHSLRRELSWADFLTYSLPVRHLPVLIFPYLFGDGSAAHQVWPHFSFVEMSGYVGLLPLAGAGLGAVAARHQKAAQFWLMVAVVTLLLTLGAATPLGRLFFHLPGYNQFRAPARHFFEFALAVSALFSLGLAALGRTPPARRMKLVHRASTATAAAIAGLWCVLFLMNVSRSGVANPQTVRDELSMLPWVNPAVGVQLALLAVSLLVLRQWARHPEGYRRARLLGVLLIDLGLFGWSGGWRDGLLDPEELRLPRALSGYRAELVGSGQRLTPLRGVIQPAGAAPPNLSRLWQVPSTSGYSPLVLRRYSELLSLSVGGAIPPRMLARENLALDILSSRYLLAPGSVSHGWLETSADGFRWPGDELRAILGLGCGQEHPRSASFHLPGLRMTEIVFVTSLSCSAMLSEGQEVLRGTLAGESGHRERFFLKAGQHTAEWAWDRPDLEGRILHGRAEVFQSFSSRDELGRAFEGHRYLARFALEGQEPLKELGLEWVGSSGEITLIQIVLRDRRTGASYAVFQETDSLRETDRWQQRQDFEKTVVFENLRAMPRAWMAARVARLRPSEILTAVHTSRLPSGERFNPRELALVEEPLDFAATDPDPTRTVRLRELSDTEVQVETQAKTASFLVLSDIDYPGWRATVDGEPTPIFRTDYLLRGVSVPAGKHVVRFSFRPASFLGGSVVTVLSLFAVLGLLVAPPFLRGKGKYESQGCPSNAGAWPSV